MVSSHGFASTRAAANHVSFLSLVEGLHGDAIEGASGCLLGRAVRSVVAGGADIVGLASAGAARGQNQHDDVN